MVKRESFPTQDGAEAGGLKCAGLIIKAWDAGKLRLEQIRALNRSDPGSPLRAQREGGDVRVDQLDAEAAAVSGAKQANTMSATADVAKIAGLSRTQVTRPVAQ